ncbi:MAG: cupin domain-containing protein [Gammaproteobacteria bacterium]|nr:cupin domain-containing protein [Gammaproteobacteria bacterium]
MRKQFALSAALLLGVFMCGAAMAGAHEAASAEPPKTAELLRYTRIYTGDDDETHFEDVPVTFVYQDYGKKIPTVWFPQDGIMDAAGFHFVSMPAGWDGGDWHPAPRRQFIIPLSGEMWFKVSDGEERVFGAGDVLLVEDTTGVGHISRMISTSLGVFAVVPLPE